MNFGVYGILIIFGAFVLLLILNPNLSCFGKRIKSPLYPLLRKRSRPAPKRIQTENYGFDLGGEKGEDDGFSPDNTKSGPPEEPSESELG